MMGMAAMGAVTTDSSALLMPAPVPSSSSMFPLSASFPVGQPQQSHEFLLLPPHQIPPPPPFGETGNNNNNVVCAIDGAVASQHFIPALPPSSSATVGAPISAAQFLLTAAHSSPQMKVEMQEMKAAPSFVGQNCAETALNEVGADGTANAIGKPQKHPGRQPRKRKERQKTAGKQQQRQRMTAAAARMPTSYAEDGGGGQRQLKVGFKLG